MDKPDIIERMASSVVTKIVTVGVAASMGGPAILVPMLSETVASKRQQKRVNDALLEMEKKIKELGEGITDSQYKIICEIILNVLQTVDDNKIDYLKSIVKKIVDRNTDMELFEADIISRILRDISSEELKFFLTISQYDKISIDFSQKISEGKVTNDGGKTKIFFPQESPKVMLITGLSQLSILGPPRTLWSGEVTDYSFSPICGKLIELLSQ